MSCTIMISKSSVKFIEFDLYNIVGSENFYALLR